MRELLKGQNKKDKDLKDGWGRSVSINLGTVQRLEIVYFCRCSELNIGERVHHVCLSINVPYHNNSTTPIPYRSSQRLHSQVVTKTCRSSVEQGIASDQVAWKE